MRQLPWLSAPELLPLLGSAFQTAPSVYSQARSYYIGICDSKFSLLHPCENVPLALKQYRGCFFSFVTKVLFQPSATYWQSNPLCCRASMHVSWMVSRIRIHLLAVMPLLSFSLALLVLCNSPQMSMSVSSHTACSIHLDALFLFVAMSNHS